MASKETAARCEDAASAAVGETSEGVVKNCDKEICDNGLSNDKELKETIVVKSNNEKMESEKNCPIEKVPSETPNEQVKVESDGTNEKMNDGNEKNGVIIIQKPKRTKSRRSLNKMPTMNNINVDVNGNATLYRTDSKMFSWLSRVPEVKQECYENVVDGLKSIYKNKMLPLEQHYLFHEFHSPSLQDADFDAKPMILLVGQYSTGKTTFIKYLLEREFPGMRIGPEPTTDRFIAVMYGENEGVIPGNALVVDPKKQFRPLSAFGNAFLNRFQCSMVKSSVLKGMSIIDTPGILSGEKQRIDRGYDFTGVLEWFAERVDRIILLFDAHKLDISDEFRRSIEALRGHDDKIRIVLNKADMIDHQQLMRVYGALMWSLGKVLQTPEVVRVYIGSFWDEPLRFDVNRKLFEAETQDLFKDLQSLPKNSALRKLNDLIKRARLAKVHAFIISEIKNQLPMFGKDNKKKDLVKNLSTIYQKLTKEHSISTGDFPDISKMQEALSKQDVNKFHSLKPKLLEVVNEMLSNDISQLMAMIPHDSPPANETVTGGAFSNVEDDKATPFGFKSGEGCNAGYGEPEWIVNKERASYDEVFDSLMPVQGKLSGATVKQELVKSKLPNAVLAKIWKLSDVDKDGYLDKDEFALAMHLINVKLKGNEIPEELPKHLVPPAKKERLYSS